MIQNFLNKMPKKKITKTFQHIIQYFFKDFIFRFLDHLQDFKARITFSLKSPKNPEGTFFRYYGFYQNI